MVPISVLHVLHVDRLNICEQNHSFESSPQLAAAKFPIRLFFVDNSVFVWLPFKKWPGPFS